MAENQRRDAARPGDQPVYEAIGPGWNSGTSGIEDDADWSPQPEGIARVALRLAVADWLRSVRSFRFWLAAAAVPLTTWLAAWIFLAASGAQGGPPPTEGRFWVYLLTAMLIPATSSFLAVHWGINGLRRSRRQPASASPCPGPLASFLAVAARGLVVAVMALFLLLVLASLAGVSGAMAGAAAGVVALEFAVFGAIGAGLSALLRRRVLAVMAGWIVAGALVVGNAVTVWALLPAVRADEPVSVTMNVDWAPGGTREAYDCAPELTGTAEVFHTERIVWMLAPNPVVLLVMLTDDGGVNKEGAGWMPGALQEAADGTHVPCVNGEPRTKDHPRMPLAVIGLATQGVLAGASLAGGQLAARRTFGPGGGVS